ncbi:hypothetical protein [Arcanobacterium buesumense]|uniref:Uncharacterized protein n=1 Tax=Arcanobacterium buesumense TaxID=2722751 RepID=A0A6H2EJB2_9ACTO|nr:hypothetical protein [Arcanobacterium buesumense]QJC21416.1 hypothetical protein HC352_02025 [Arcanobacterium buesumense]
MKLISRLIFTHQLRLTAIWALGLITGIYVINVCTAYFFGASGGLQLSAKFFDVELQSIPPSGDLGQLPTVVGATTLGLSGLLPIVSAGLFIAVFGEGARAWLAAGVNRRTIYATCQAFAALTTVVITALICLLIGGTIFTGAAVFTGFSLTTVVDTLLICIVISQLALLVTAVFLRFSMWIGMSLLIGIPLAVGLFIGNVGTWIPQLIIGFDLANNDLLLCVLLIAFSLLMAVLSWLLLYRFPMRRG